jgi:hypothetical protein
MIKKSLLVLVTINAITVLAFVMGYLQHRSLVPLYIGLLPFTLCNFIYTREFIAPKAVAAAAESASEGKRKMNIFPLLIMPVCFLLGLPALLRFDRSLGWSPVVCIGFSVLLCIVIIAFYGAVRMAVVRGAS